jgi:hypothetical protein
MLQANLRITIGMKLITAGNMQLLVHGLARYLIVEVTGYYIAECYIMQNEGLIIKLK